MLNVGHNNFVQLDKIVSIYTVQQYMSAPIKAAIKSAKETDRLIDLTAGRRTKSVIFTVSGQVVLSSIEGGTLIKRVKKSVDA